MNNAHFKKLILDDDCFCCKMVVMFDPEDSSLYLSKWTQAGDYWDFWTRLKFAWRVFKNPYEHSYDLGAENVTKLKNFLVQETHFADLGVEK